ncbi:MAG: RHS repeat protein, partial [Candidatus Omnitrophica bacterium]|nr:RHS repeat protein [Candidatus Omnitrophota bacterium]
MSPERVSVNQALTLAWHMPFKGFPWVFDQFGQLSLGWEFIYLREVGDPTRRVLLSFPLGPEATRSVTAPLPEPVQRALQPGKMYEFCYLLFFYDTISLDGETASPPSPFIEVCSNPFVVEGGSGKPLPQAREDQRPAVNPSHQDREVQQATDPMDIHRGEFVLGRQDLLLTGRGPAVEITFTYRSRSTTDGPFSYGWETSYRRRIQKLDNNNLVVFRENNRSDEFTFTSPTTYTAPPGVYDTLTKQADGTAVLTSTHGEREVYDTSGKLTRLEDRVGNPLTFTYQGDRLIRIMDASNRAIDFTYTPQDRLETTTYAGRTITYQVDPTTGDLLSVTTPPTPEFPQGLTTRYTYTNHNLEAITDPKGQTYLTNVYDQPTDRVLKQTYGQGTSTLVYGKDAQGNPTTQVTDRRGFKTLFTFDAAGHITKKEPFTDGNPPNEPTSYVTSYEYNTAGERTRVVFPRGNSIEYTYDDKGNLLEQRRKKIGAPKGVPDPTDLVWRFTYEPRFNLLKTATDPRGNVTTYLYDYELGEPAQGNLRRITGPPVDGLSPVTTFTYTRVGQVETVTDPTGVVTKYTYDQATGYLLTTTDGWGTPLAGTTRFTTDALGNITATIDPNGHKTTFAYNALNQLTTVTTPFGLQTAYAYDANGNLLQADHQAKDVKPGPRPPLGTSTPTDDWQTTRYGYTPLDQLISVTDDLSHVSAFGYDQNGNRTTLTDAKSQKTTSVYDERNLLGTVTDAATPAGVTASRYDPNGNLRELKDANGNPTTYLYDDFDRLTRTTYADGSFEEYGYDANGNLTSRITPAGQRLSYEYNARDLLTKTIAPEDTTTFTYDPASRLLTAANSTSTLTFRYDQRGRPKTVTSSQSPNPSITQSLILAYDAAGNRTHLMHPDGFTVLSFYDALQRLIGLDFSATTLGGSNGGGETEPFPYPSPSPSPDPSRTAMIQFVYDALSRRIGLLLPNGLRTTYGYDAANRLLSLTITRGRNLLLSLASTYDPLGNRLSSEVRSEKSEVRRTSYDYDVLSQLTSTTANGVKIDYRYDAVGNRLTAAGQPYTPNRLNQYDAVGATTLRHDTNGNVTFDGVNTYAYDSENRLIRVERPGLIATFTYDALGRRVSKTVNGVTIHFLYDGDQLIADYDASGKLLARYVYGPGLDEPLVMLKAGKTYYFHPDPLGSIIALSDDRGQIVERYTYDAFGQPTILAPDGTVRTASVVGNRFMFTGREYDFETGLYHSRTRTLHPGLGRFLQREPQPTDLH